MLRCSRTLQRVLLQAATRHTSQLITNSLKPTQFAVCSAYEKAFNKPYQFNSFKCLSSDHGHHSDDEHEPSEQDKVRMSEVYKILSHPPNDLYYDRGERKVPTELDNPVGRLLARLLGFNSEKSKLGTGGRRLYGAVKEMSDTGEMQKAFNTGSTFWATYVILSLHVWMVIWRLRSVNHKDLKHFREWFYLAFQQDVEKRIYASGVDSRVSKWLRTLEEHFFRTGYELDLVLMGQSDRTMSDVLLDLYYANDSTKIDEADMLAAYIDRELECMKMTEDAVILSGNVKFSCSFIQALEAADIPLEFDESAVPELPKNLQ
uniref:Ubiquinol-cytochrome c chaperone domain-containing protein n=1 Tax=Polytomella parva TaxID=51329 RepID=A0A7S0VNT8_9CHLO|mmetsp:Transcript_998/g.1418  ORF Transcript_998/g.1418 Transcript_998/m.1418 type:complete len:318 (+) Transcript_998:69-1022(+)|eukprot:CAMPEP_0175073024 /NCGR_PEP_ID=MMETSP0052_2-20121109/20283_1 /TAXON_ID=51329 ORGANISM="Polytomella parva, Strain SAG 63-3" /NCGR_SAMPLE_ID=MMETSP0052_2 /ASSEMBLY_ACC=CAM_ASM_000194 /LENGTH=317 /DNA_ID=CAMNT_0016340689 /DNA_START=30 /DNA_END=983 /DNA_ORIENTATION=+